LICECCFLFYIYIYIFSSFDEFFNPDILQGMELERCVNSSVCLSRKPKLVVGLRGSTANIFVDNAAYRDFLYQTYAVSSVDMESSAVVMVRFLGLLFSFNSSFFFSFLCLYLLAFRCLHEAKNIICIMRAPSQLVFRPTVLHNSKRLGP
jgi:hypothetical protein